MSIAAASGAAVTLVSAAWTLKAWFEGDGQLTGGVLLLTFFTIGAGLFTGLYPHFARRDAADYAFALAHPDTPWRWRPEWRQSAIADEGSKSPWLHWVWSLLLIGIVAPFHVDAWDGVGVKPEQFVPVILTGVVMLIGLGVSLYAGYLQWRRFRYGLVRFVPTSIPGVIGGTVGGYIEIPGGVRLQAGDQIELTLSCERTVRNPRGETKGATIWASTQTVSGHSLNHDQRSTRIPVEFEVPPGLPESNWDCWDALGARTSLNWKLHANARTPGVDFSCTFTIPVFLIPSSGPRIESAEVPASTTATSSAAVLAAAGIGGARALAMLEQSMRADRSSVRLNGRDYLQAILPNLLTACGVVVLGWSVSLILLLYWLENVVGSFLWYHLIRRHQAATHLRGHYQDPFELGSPVRSFSIAAGHLIGTSIFNLGHGLFLFLIAFWALDGSAVLDDLAWVALLAGGMVIAALVDIQPFHRNLERRSFAWLRQQGGISQWPILSMHLGMLFGAAALDGGGMALALVFILVRLCFDLARIWYQKITRDEMGPQPSRPDGMDDARYALLVAAHDGLRRQEEVCPPEERRFLIR